MYAIVSAAGSPEHRDTLIEWCRDEWEDVAGLDGSVSNPAAPPPLLAVDGDVLLGGLVFTIFAEPGSSAPGCWVNAVIVAPPYRRRGIASALIRSAEAEALAAGHMALYALTDVPALYRQIGWTVASRGDNGVVVMRRIAADG